MEALPFSVGATGLVEHVRMAKTTLFAIRR